MPNFRDILYNIKNVPSLFMDDDDFTKTLTPTNLRHLMVDTLVEKGFIVKPQFQNVKGGNDRWMLFISAPLVVLMEEAAAMSIPFPLKELWTDHKPTEALQPTLHICSKSGQKASEMICSALGDVLWEPAMPLEKGTSGRYGEVPWEVSGRLVAFDTTDLDANLAEAKRNLRQDYEKKLSDADKEEHALWLAGSLSYDDDEDEGVAAQLSYEQLIGMYKEPVIATKGPKQRCKAENIEITYNSQVSKSQTDIKKTHKMNDVNVKKLAAWYEDVLVNGAQGKSLIKDNLNTSYHAEKGIAYLHLSHTLELAMKAKHGPYLVPLITTFKEKLFLGELKGSLEHVDEAREWHDSKGTLPAALQTLFDHFVHDELKELSRAGKPLHMAWEDPNVIPGKLLEHVLHDLSQNGVYGVIMYHKSHEASKLHDSLWWIDPIIPAVLVGARGEFRFSQMLQDYKPLVRITRKPAARHDPRTHAPFQQETVFKSEHQHAYIHLNRSSGQPFDGKQGEHAVADGAICSMRRQMCTVESLQRLDLEDEHGVRRHYSEEGVNRYSNGRLFNEKNKYVFADYHVIHFSLKRHVPPTNEKVSLKNGTEELDFLHKEAEAEVAAFNMHPVHTIPHTNLEWILGWKLLSDYILPHDKDKVFDQMMITPTEISVKAELNALAASGYKKLDDDSRAYYESLACDPSSLYSDGIVLYCNANSDDVRIARKRLVIDDRVTILKDWLWDNETQGEKRTKQKKHTFGELFEKEKRADHVFGINFHWRDLPAKQKLHMQMMENDVPGFAKNVGVSMEDLSTRAQLYNTIGGVKETRDFNPFRNFQWKPFGSLPISWIRRYVGEHDALLVLWLQTLSQTLWMPMLVGIGVFLYGLYNIWHGDKALDTDTVLASMTNNAGTAIYAVVMCIWTAVWCEKWTRIKNSFTLKWGTFESSDQQRTGRVRPNFTATILPPGSIRMIPEGHQSITQSMKKMCCSYAIILTFMVIVIGSMVGVVIVRIVVDNPDTLHALLNSTLGLDVGDGKDATEAVGESATDATSSYASYAASAAVYAPSFIQSFLIVLFTGIYKFLAHLLTEYENHRTEEEYKSHYIVKLFLFQMVNFFSGLYYVAFFRQGVNPDGEQNYTTVLSDDYRDSCGENGDCMGMLSMSVLTTLVMVIVMTIFSEEIMPYFKRQLRLREPRSWWELEQTLQLGVVDPARRLVTDTTVDFFCKKIMLYGLVVMFATAMPLAPLIFFISIMVDFHFIGQRKIKHTRRTLALNSGSIGQWEAVIVFVNLVAVLTNAFLLIHTHSDFPKQVAFYLHPNAAERNNRTSWKEMDDEDATYGIVIFEHFILLIMFAVKVVIPNVAEGTLFKVYSQKKKVAKHFASIAHHDRLLQFRIIKEAAADDKVGPSNVQNFGSIAEEEALELKVSTLESDNAGLKRNTRALESKVKALESSAHTTNEFDGFGSDESINL
jgi:hypothetical protein